MPEHDPQKSLARLEELVAERGRSGRWLVLTHDNPDPDALAAAHVMTHVLRGHCGVRVTIGYGGIIGRAENREMVRALKLQLSHVRHLQWSRYRCFVLVDTQPRTGNNQLPRSIVPDVVLDHHPQRKASAAAAIVDVRPEYGATATIAAEYLLASGLRITRAEATAVVYAIRTETRDLAREVSPADRKVFEQLFPLVSQRALSRIQNPRLPLSYFAMLHRALDRLESLDTLVVSHLGEVSQPDMVPEIADLLLRLEGKTWSFCTGAYRDRLYLSLRTTNPRADAGNLMRRLIGRRGRGGGHGMSAGGWVHPRAPNGDPTATEERRLTERLAELLGKPPERLAPLPLPGTPPEG